MNTKCWSVDDGMINPVLFATFMQTRSIGGVGVRVHFFLANSFFINKQKIKFILSCPPLHTFWAPPLKKKMLHVHLRVFYANLK